MVNLALLDLVLPDFEPGLFLTVFGPKPLRMSGTARERKSQVLSAFISIAPACFQRVEVEIGSFTW